MQVPITPAAPSALHTAFADVKNTLDAAQRVSESLSLKVASLESALANAHGGIAQLQYGIKIVLPEAPLSRSLPEHAEDAPPAKRARIVVAPPEVATECHSSNDGPAPKDDRTETHVSAHALFRIPMSTCTCEDGHHESLQVESSSVGTGRTRSRRTVSWTVCAEFMNPSAKTLAETPCTNAAHTDGNHAPVFLESGPKGRKAFSYLDCHMH
ncbi:hypothetical protein B0H17DRAFT_1197353 [Mycena rosella]|uniref:Uncharacterized protein n=1 Tax=Mycena rosella TaxID=1033263 RepID=A0AAD7DQZ6_MYCRO|nr:hypothetical protein B0H17DRAFT_1197353 [Mycena rosella]